jgi:hypothetical protein
MGDEIKVGDRVRVYLDAKNWGRGEWFNGTVVRIEPYSQHRSFHWVELDADAQAILGGRMPLISVFNPKNIRKTE